MFEQSLNSTKRVIVCHNGYFWLARISEQIQETEKYLNSELLAHLLILGDFV